MALTSIRWRSQTIGCRPAGVELKSPQPSPSPLAAPFGGRVRGLNYDLFRQCRYNLAQAACSAAGNGRFYGQHRRQPRPLRITAYPLPRGRRGLRRPRGCGRIGERARPSQSHLRPQCHRCFEPGHFGPGTPQKPRYHPPASNTTRSWRPLRALENHDLRLTVVPCQSDGSLDLTHIERAISADTTLIALTHASNVTGTLLPISQVGAIARRHGLLLLVDAAQTAGAAPHRYVGGQYRPVGLHRPQIPLRAHRNRRPGVGRSG